MKQMSMFIVMIVFLNVFVQIRNIEMPYFESPQIIRSNINSEEPQKKSVNSALFKALNGREENSNSNDSGFSTERLNKWLEHLESEDIKTMDNQTLDKNLDAIRMASLKIRNYLEENTKKVESIISVIDLKVKEIDKIDINISKIRPSYKEELQKISKDNGSLLSSLEKEKNLVDEVLEKLKSETSSIELLGKKSTEVENKINSYVLLKDIKEKVNANLVKFMKLSYFEPSHKRLIKLIESKTQDELLDLNKEYEKYDSSHRSELIAAEFIKSNWSKILEEEQEKFKLNSSESSNAINRVTSNDKSEKTNVVDKDEEEDEEDEEEEEKEENKAETNKDKKQDAREVKSKSNEKQSAGKSSQTSTDSKKADNKIESKSSTENKELLKEDEKNKSNEDEDSEEDESEDEDEDEEEDNNDAKKDSNESIKSENKKDSIKSAIKNESKEEDSDFEEEEEESKSQKKVEKEVEYNGKLKNKIREEELEQNKKDAEELKALRKQIEEEELENDSEEDEEEDEDEDEEDDESKEETEVKSKNNKSKDLDSSEKSEENEDESESVKSKFAKRKDLKHKKH